MYDLTKIKNDVRKPPRILIHGIEGVGKTSFACQAPSPIMLNLERGIPDRYIESMPQFQADTYQDCIDLLGSLYKQEHPYKTLIIDSLDVLEVILTAQAQKTIGSNELTKNYGAGYSERSNMWSNIILGLNALNDKGMIILCIAHSVVTKVMDPLLPEYDKQTLRLYKTETSRFVDWSDITGYALIKTYTSNEGKRNLAQTAGEHVIMTHTNPAYTAKTRYEMPDEIPMEWSALAQYIPALNSEQNTKEE